MRALTLASRGLALADALVAADTRFMLWGPLVEDQPGLAGTALEVHRAGHHGHRGAHHVPHVVSAEVAGAVAESVGEQVRGRVEKQARRFDDVAGDDCDD